LLGPDEHVSLDHQRLEIIYGISTELAGNQDVTSLGGKIFSKFRQIFKQDRGYIAVCHEDGSLKTVCLDPPGQTFPLSRSITSRLMRHGESFILEDALSDAAFKEQESIMALRIRSALCVPLIYHNQIYGLMYLDRNVPGAFSREDLEFLRSIASIVAPLIENARLWSELKRRYDHTVETLKETEASLIKSERTSAYVRLAHAMAHEIRNPLMVVGGLIRKISRSESKTVDSDVFKAILESVERVELVLREVDSFVKIPPPEKKLQRIDQIVEEEIGYHNEIWQMKDLSTNLTVNTSNVLVPVDEGLFRKALSMVFREISFGIPQKSRLNIEIRDSGNELEIVFGHIDKREQLCEPYDPDLRGKPMSISLFLNIAYKIVSEHGGKMLLDPQAYSAFPIVIMIPRMRGT
jgi:GAF domain-containing protein